MTKRERELAKQNLDTLIDMRDNMWRAVVIGEGRLDKHTALDYAVKLAEKALTDEKEAVR